MMQYTLKTGPTSELLTVEEAKTHCRVTTSSEDDLFLLWTAAARQWIEHSIGRALMRQTWQLSLPALQPEIPLPYAAPLGAVTFVKYYDANNVLQTWASANYITPTFHEPAVIDVLDTATWPSTYLRSDAVQIEYTAGYDQSFSVPSALRAAALLLISHWNEHREAVSGDPSHEVALAVEALCAPYRIWVPTC